MMTHTKAFLIPLFSVLFIINGFCQDILLADQAVKMAIENNFDIKRSRNATEIAKNEASKFNTGQLPTVSLTGAANWSIDNTNVTFQSGDETTLTWVSTQNAAATLTASYTIFDGFFRKYNIKQLSQQYLLTELQIQAAMENLAAQTLSQYYKVAALENTMIILTEAIDISQQRLKRAQVQVEYGQVSELDMLNAQVDLNNDSLNYQNAILLLENAKRGLNRLMVSDVNTNYQVASNLDFFQNIDQDGLRQNVVQQNIQLEQIDKNIAIGNITIDMANANKLPSLGANLSYGYNYNKNNPSSFLASSNSNGLTAGLTLSWNIFDGGSTKVAIENAKLNVIDLEYQKEQMLYDLTTDFDIAWANYKNTLMIYETNQKNELINRQNFERTEEQFKIGQINSVEFRQAQLNLLNAQNGLIGSTFDVKISEVQLLLLSGNILD